MLQVAELVLLHHHQPALTTDLPLLHQLIPIPMLATPSPVGAMAPTPTLLALPIQQLLAMSH